MKPVKIITFPAGKTFNRFVRHFKTKSNNSGLPILDIPEHLGNGQLLAMDLYDDLSIIYLNGLFKEEVLLTFKSDSINPLHFIYNYKNPLDYKNDDATCWQELDRFQHAISSNPVNVSKQIRLKANKNYCSYIISVSKSAYLNNRRYCTKSLATHLRGIFEDKDEDSPFFHCGSYNLEIADILKRISIRDYSSIEHLIYLEAKIHELINLHLLQYKKDIERERWTHTLSSYEVRAIHRATNYIENNIDKISTVSQVSRQVGLNSNKLQQGFSEIYNISVNRFIRNVRMAKAKDLLMNSEESIAQIVSNIGLSSNSYFSRLFKEQYKVSPSVFRIKMEKRN